MAPADGIADKARIPLGTRLARCGGFVMRPPATTKSEAHPDHRRA